MLYFCVDFIFGLIRIEIKMVVTLVLILDILCEAYDVGWDFTFPL